MGFFTPDKSANYYAGIWYAQIEPQTVIWVANRDTPIPSVDMDSTSLKLLDGNLVLVNNAAGEFLWSTNSTRSNNSVRATLLDTGNLVLSHGPYSNSTPPVWQSFDHPSNTFMPNAKLGYNKRTGEKQSLRSWKSGIDPSPGLFSLEMNAEIGEYVLKWNGTEQYWSSGSWNGTLFNSIPGLRSNTIYNFTYVNNDNETYYAYYFYNSAVISRFIIDISGQIRHYTWLDSSKTWNIFFRQPEKQCDVYAYCGPFGVCNGNSSSFCDCLPRFRHKSDEDWGLKDFSGGCVRRAELQCGNGSSAADSQDRFRRINNMRLPRYPRNVTVGSVAECESACLGNCSCNAYAYDNRNGCSHWDGELLNLSEDEINGSTIYIRLAASEFLDAVQDHQNGNKKSGKLKVILPVTVAALLLILASIFTYIYYRKRNIRKEGDNDIEANYLVEEHDEKHIDVPFFSFAWRLWNEGKIRELVQKSLLPLEAKHESEVLKCINVGLLCVQEQPGDRPSMPNALVMMLSTDSTALPRPNQPAFITRTGMSPATSTSASSGLPQSTQSRNELSVTVFEGR
nr:G-type lectin S-receptor-like serine/threonine-protein kinase At4g27290 isoform X1 [Ipomoea batatas]